MNPYGADQSTSGCLPDRFARAKVARVSFTWETKRNCCNTPLTCFNFFNLISATLHPLRTNASGMDSRSRSGQAQNTIQCCVLSLENQIVGGMSQRKKQKLSIVTCKPETPRNVWYGRENNSPVLGATPVTRPIHPIKWTKQSSARKHRKNSWQNKILRAPSVVSNVYEKSARAVCSVYTSGKGYRR